MWLVRWAALLAWAGCVLAAGNTTSPPVTLQPVECKLSQFKCESGQCVSLDRYCDGEDDCGDKSDEPRLCTREYNFNLLFYTRPPRAISKKLVKLHTI
jgi:hypothetical protein